MGLDEEETLPLALAPGVTPPERIEVDELVLRRWAPDDLPARLEALIASYELLHPWLEWMSEPPTLESQRAWEELRGLAWPGETGFNYGIFGAAEGSVLGAISAMDRIGQGGLEIGYWGHVAHTGKGVITRAARELTRILLGLDGIERVEIHCDEANTPSAAVPRRLGYRLDRIEDDPAHAAPLDSGRTMVWIMQRERAASAN